MSIGSDFLRDNLENQNFLKEEEEREKELSEVFEIEEYKEANLSPF